MRHLLLLMVFITIASSCYAESSERETLRGLSGVGVRIVIYDKSGTLKNLIIEDVLKSQIELKLRRAGVTVLSEKALTEDVEMPTLDLEIWGIPDDQSSGEILSYALRTSLAVNRRVFISRKGFSPHTTFLDCWNREFLSVYGIDTIRNGALKSLASDLTDQFLNDWLATHEPTRLSSP